MGVEFAVEHDYTSLPQLFDAAGQLGSENPSDEGEVHHARRALWLLSQVPGCLPAELLVDPDRRTALMRLAESATRIRLCTVSWVAAVAQEPGWLPELERLGRSAAEFSVVNARRCCLPAIARAANDLARVCFEDPHHHWGVGRLAEALSDFRTGKALTEVPIVVGPTAPRPDVLMSLAVRAGRSSAIPDEMVSDSAWMQHPLRASTVDMMILSPRLALALTRHPDAQIRRHARDALRGHQGRATVSLFDPVQTAGLQLPPLHRYQASATTE
ncbi:hypothetical protein [Amycolatopsis sp. lyj-23]|uniref:hypothetical protein n=1 Tax=Amycolatopsis sp. lyj-23 TaxID=2789283 RepID=UPI00397E02E0